MVLDSALVFDPSPNCSPLCCFQEVCWAEKKVVNASTTPICKRDPYKVT